MRPLFGRLSWSGISIKLILESQLLYMGGNDVHNEYIIHRRGMGDDQEGSSGHLGKRTSPWTVSLFSLGQVPRGPQWNNNSPHSRAKMQDLGNQWSRELENQPLRHNVSQRHLKFSNHSNSRTQKEETPSAFSEWLRDHGRKYAGLDPESAGQGLLKVNFVTKSWPDSTKKLQNWMV